MPLSLGQGSGDFRETSGRVQIFHVGTRNSVGILTADAFTQANPVNVTAGANVSTTLAGISKKGVLGASFAFSRPDAGNGFHGGPLFSGGSAVAAQKPLGLFINDSLGNAFENTPGVASGRGPYLCGYGTVGVSIWETQVQVGASTALTYAAGDKLYASVNGFVTNVAADANEVSAPTIIGILKVAPDANNSLMVFDLRI